MSVQISCKSHRDLIKTKKAMLQTMSDMAFFGTQWQVNLKWEVWIQTHPRLYAIWYLLPASLMKVQLKLKSPGHYFPHYISMGAFGWHGNESFDRMRPKCLLSLSPTPVMLHITFDQDSPICLRDIQVWKCGRTICILLSFYLVILRLRWAKYRITFTSAKHN